MILKSLQLVCKKYKQSETNRSKSITKKMYRLLHFSFVGGRTIKRKDSY